MSTGPSPQPVRETDFEQQIVSLLEKALDFGPRDRVVFLRQSCGEDARLYDAVMGRLLERAESRPFGAPSGAMADFDSGMAEGQLPVEPPDRSGERVGTYRLVSRIGLGGMGEVYLAERDDGTYRQRVAIKLVNEGLYGRLTYGRLRAERQILASLEHPNIARMLDGGTASDGTPYFVMEYVDGTPLDVFCDERRLDVEARLRLFRSICAAVHCAHQNLVVHRDLKPSNILVTADGAVKLLDFGIAKLLDANRAHHTVAVTQASVRLMTPNYASPEQITGVPITTATDIYALGLLLYELLTGKRAFQMPSQHLHDIERIMKTVAVPLPSTAILCKETPGDAGRTRAARIAEARSTTPRRLYKQLSGDLDVIVLKALQLEPERRYASVEQFSRDIGSFLDGHPIVAQRDTWVYRSRKFIARHKFAVGASSVIVVLLCGFAAAMYVQAQRIAEQRDRATAEEARAATVSSFLVELFELSDPSRSRGATITAREILDAGARRVNEGLRGQPETQATLLETIGRVYGNLGLYRNAEEAARNVLELRTTGAAREGDVVAALALLGQSLLEQGDYRAAESYLNEAIELRRSLRAATVGGVSVSEAELVHQLGRLRQSQGQYEAAETLYRQSLAMQVGSENGEVSSVLTDLAQILERKADLPGAITMTRDALAMDEKQLGPDHPQVGIQRYNLAYLLSQQGDLEAAGPLYEQSVAGLTRVLGETHPDTVRVMAGFGRYLQRSGQYAEAEQRLRVALARQIAIRGEEDSEVAYDRVSLALLLEETGNLAGAEAELRTAQQIFAARLPPDHQYLASALTALGRVLAVTGREAEALPLLNRALGIWEAQLPMGHPQIAVTRAALTRARSQAGNRTETVVELQALQSVLLDAYGPEHIDSRRVAQWLAEASQP